MSRILHDGGVLIEETIERSIMSSSLPVPLSKAVLSLTPQAALSHVVELVWRRMEHRHPKLLKNLARLDNALVYLEPTDVPHNFALTMGDRVQFYVISDEESEARTADATVKGGLQALVDMLEGREDGDTLFFSRDIQISGNTEVIVGLRNTLDREEVDLFTEVLSLCGPFAKPAGMAIHMADQFLGHMKGRIEKAHDHMHKSKELQ